MPGNPISLPPSFARKTKTPEPKTAGNPTKTAAKQKGCRKTAGENTAAKQKSCRKTAGEMPPQSKKLSKDSRGNTADPPGTGGFFLAAAPLPLKSRRRPIFGNPPAATRRLWIIKGAVSEAFGPAAPVLRGQRAVIPAGSGRSPYRAAYIQRRSCRCRHP